MRLNTKWKGQEHVQILWQEPPHFDMPLRLQQNLCCDSSMMPLATKGTVPKYNIIKGHKLEQNIQYLHRLHKDTRLNLNLTFVHFFSSWILPLWFPKYIIPRKHYPKVAKNIPRTQLLDIYIEWQELQRLCILGPHMKLSRLYNILSICMLKTIFTQTHNCLTNIPL